MKHLRLAVLVGLALTVLAPAAQASSHRSTLVHVQVPLAFEEGGDGTGYASWQAPSDIRLVRVRVVGNEVIDTVTVLDSPLTSVQSFAEAVTYVIEPGDSTVATVPFDPVYGFQRGQWVNVMVAAIPPASLTPTGYVRLTYSI